MRLLFAMIEKCQGIRTLHNHILSPMGPFNPPLNQAPEGWLVHSWSERGTDRGNDSLDTMPLENSLTGWF